MNKSLDKSGFTLIEMLAVLVILSAIMAIALPSITSSLERNKKKQNENKKEMLESFAEIYVADHKNAIYNSLDGNNVEKCSIEISSLNAGDAAFDSDGNVISGYIVFDRSTNSYIYSENKVGNVCLNN